MQSIASLRASNGAANASVVTVQSIRSPGAATIAGNTVTGLPPFFIATMGAPHTFTDPVTGETITIISDATAVDFAGHVNGSNLVIDTIAPGYADTRGSLVGDIVVLRPTTFYADTLANVLAQSHNDDGSFKADSIVSEVPFADNVDPTIRLAELGANYVASGALLAGLGYGSTLTASLASGVVYINGFRQLIAAVATRGYTASKDTYVDALYNASGTATIVYTEQTNNGASPALAANSVRLGIVVTGATNIAAATSIAQGGFANTLPVISSQILKGFDTLGNPIYPKGGVTPKKTQIGIAFSVFRNGAWLTGTANQFNKVAFDTKTFDFGANFDVVTNNRFVAPVAGLYQFESTVKNSGSADYIQIALYKNGAQAKMGGGAIEAAGAIQMGLTVSGLLQLAVGDYVEVWYFDNGTNQTGLTGAPNTFFDGFLVSVS